MSETTQTFEELFGSEATVRQIHLSITSLKGWDVTTWMRSFGYNLASFDPLMDVDAFVLRWTPVIERIIAGGEA